MKAQAYNLGTFAIQVVGSEKFRKLFDPSKYLSQFEAILKEAVAYKPAYYVT